MCLAAALKRQLPQLGAAAKVVHMLCCAALQCAVQTTLCCLVASVCAPQSCCFTWVFDFQAATTAYVLMSKLLVAPLR